MKLKQVGILAISTFICLTSFFAVYIPSMYLNFKFMYILIGENMSILGSLLIWASISFGLLCISLVVSGTILHYFVVLYDWQTKYDELKQKG